MAKVKDAIQAGCTAVQLRAKDLGNSDFLSLAYDLRQLAQRQTFIINDRVDIAIAANADGAHLGQEDMPLKSARLLLGPNKIIGCSTHNFRQATAAAEENTADYIALGPIYPTRTKPDLLAIGTELISTLKPRIKLPVVVIGNINAQTIRTAAEHGAENFAFASWVMCATDVKQAVRRLQQALAG